MIREVTAVLSDSRFASLFAPGTRAEVPIVGRIDRPGRPALNVSGQVDRLAVTEGLVLIGDYKTGRQIPQRIEDVPAAHITQLALYRAVLRTLYPGREVRAALVWTYGPELLELDEAALDTAFARVTSS
jgi:ATP-dependent helicase/nuclease subunit A